MLAKGTPYEKRYRWEYSKKKKRKEKTAMAREPRYSYTSVCKRENLALQVKGE